MNQTIVISNATDMLSPMKLFAQTKTTVFPPVIIVLFLSLCLCLCLLWPSQVKGGEVSAAQLQQTIKVVCDPWPPWIEGQEGGVATGGVFVEITRQLFANMGIDVEFTLMPFTRVLSSIKSGDADVALMVSKSEQRQAFGLYSSRILSSAFYLYSINTLFVKQMTAKQLPVKQWHSWQQFSDYKIGVTRGFNYGSAFDRAVERKTLSLYWSIAEKDLLSLLLKGRLDLVILNEHTANFLFEALPEAGFENLELNKLSPSVNNPEFFLFISKKSKFNNLLGEINKQVKAMQERKEITKIIDSYHLKK